VLLLVSQYWLNSDFVRDVEVGEALQRRALGLTIVPVLLAPCDWQAESWLSRLQLLPQGGRPLTDYADDRGAREAAFLSVLRTIRDQAEAARRSASPMERGPRPGGRDGAGQCCLSASRLVQ
jgi:hypothetical protein